jgi:hypothetical protein
MFYDFREPTALPTEQPDDSKKEERFVSHRIAFAPAMAEAVQTAARRLRVTPNSIVQGFWALLLSRQNNSAEVVFGSAFSGRPTDLDNAESIVGPFVNTLPLKVTVNPEDTLGRFLQEVHSLLLSVSPHQFTSLFEIQRCTRVPERLRLFDSLVVFQNYLIDDAAKSFGGQVQISDFVGPIHTNYPLMLLVEPHAGLQLTLIYDSQLLARAAVERWAGDIAKLLENIAVELDERVGDLQQILSVPARLEDVSSRQLRTQSLNVVLAQSPLELAIAAVWAEMFGLDCVSVEENFFDLGGHSLLLVKMHRRLQETLYPELSIVTLFEHPTVRSLAHHLDHVRDGSQDSVTGELLDRARQQKRALEQLRARLKKSS